MHTGSILNGLLAIAAIGSLIHPGGRAQRVLLISAVVPVWGNVIGYFAAAVAVLIAVVLVTAGVLPGPRLGAGEPGRPEAVATSGR